jgi:hypothetical protein
MRLSNVFPDRTADGVLRFLLSLLTSAGGAKAGAGLGKITVISKHRCA